jgi:hypothetical protein
MFKRITIALLLCAGMVGAAQTGTDAARPGSRVLLDAHNCYPYYDWWTDRIDRALSTGTPIAIEQDLYWYKGASLLAHGEPMTGAEPRMKEYFFERIRPIMEKALRDNERQNWPLITLNLDFKTEEPEHLRAVWNLLNEYRDWITSAQRTTDTSAISALAVRPLLVLTGESNAQMAVFHDQVPVGSRLLVFGATPIHLQDPQAPPETIAPAPADNYHRWWNNPWRVVEPGGQNAAGAWTPAKEARLNALVRSAHERGLWIRFYTLDGGSAADESARGMFHTYNFGSLDAARVRWQAAIRAGVDYVATDLYEEFAGELHRNGVTGPIVITGTLTRADHHRLFEREFDVPAGINSLKISLAYSGVEQRTVIDLGLRSPAEFRGWSGGGPQTIVVGPTFATYGYLSGPIEAGKWAVVLGVPNLREGSTDTYTVTIEELPIEEPSFPVLRRGPAWFAGDFHSHSGHSDGHAELADGSRVKIPPHRVFDAARLAGLDFIALTDHNTPSHWTEIDRLQPYYSSLLLLHSREITTYDGHLNAFGERQFVDFRVSNERRLRNILDELAVGGAFLSINHPALPNDENCMGCGWGDKSPETLSRIQAVEVVNGDSAEGLLSGWPVWVKMLNSGLHLTAIGGSDDHSADETQDHAIGRPATVVYAEDLSEPALLEGLRKGRVYIRTRGALGPTLRFEAASADNRWEMGDTIPKSLTNITLSATMSRCAGQRLEWIKNGDVISRTPVSEDSPATMRVQSRPGDWFSVILRDDSGATLYSNPIYIER